MRVQRVVLNHPRQPAGHWSAGLNADSPRFSANRQRTESLMKVTKNCAYCELPLAKSTNQRAPNNPTFDHIRPKDAQGPALLSNGVLACPPCNNVKRGNIPVLAFLQGDNGTYQFHNSGNLVIRGEPIFPAVSAEEITKRQAAFSNYLKTFVSARHKVNPFQKDTWFVQAVDNLLYPVWKTGQAPKDLVDFNKHYRKRVKELIQVLAKADSAYWLGDNFKAIVKQDFAVYPEKQKAFLNALKTNSP